MRSSSFHAVSAIVGTALAMALFFATGAAQAAKQVVPVTIQQGLTRIAGIPDPRDMMVVEDGVPFTVPVGKLFVLTAMGTRANDGLYTNLTVDGVLVVRTTDSSPMPMVPVPIGFTAKEGQVIDVCTPNTAAEGRAWGYLVDS